MLYAGADELVHTTTAVALQQAMAATGYPYTWWMHPAADHGTLANLDDWRKESIYSAPWTRQANPPRVTYRFDPSLDEPEYGLVHDHAYWVSQLRTAGVGVGQVDLTTSRPAMTSPSGTRKVWRMSLPGVDGWVWRSACDANSGACAGEWL